MRTLHLLPGESRGDTADIVLTPAALDQLMGVLAQAKDNGFACGRFVQRDRAEYTLCVEVLNAPGTDRMWRDTPMAYLKGQVRHLRFDVKTSCSVDLSLLGSDLYAKRKANKHDQKTAAEILGLSVSSVSLIEHGKQEPKLDSLVRICAYLGEPLGTYLVLD